MPASSIRSRIWYDWQRHDPWKSVCGSGTGNIVICQVHSGCTILCCAALAGPAVAGRHTAEHHRGNGDLNSGTGAVTNRDFAIGALGNFEVSARLGESYFSVI